MSETLDVELELLGSSLLPAETLAAANAGDESPQTSSGLAGALPCEFAVANADSGRRLAVSVQEGYPALSAVHVALKGGDMDRDAALRSEQRIQHLMQEHWDEADEYVAHPAVVRN